MAKHGSVWVACIFVIALILLGIVVRSLWVTIPKPKGRRLRGKQAPNLFKFVDELSNERGDTEKIKYYQDKIEQHYYRQLFSSTGLDR
ncbi:MAG: hypothetical protein AAF316_00795 [Cyanobacteria bacterium P01_A01_bin.80]